MKDNNLKSIFFAVAAVFFWSTVATAFKLTLRSMSFAQMLFYSSIASTLVLFVITLLTDRRALKQIFQKEFFIKNMLLGFLNPFTYYMVLFKSYSLLNAQEAQTLNFTWPITISLFAILFLKERASFNIYLGLLSAFFGIIIISTKGSLNEIRLENHLGGILAIGSSLIWAAFWTIKILDPRREAAKLLGAFLWGSLYTALYIALFDTFKVPLTPAFSGTVYIGIFEMGLTFYLWMKALKLSSNRARTSTLAYLAPFLSLVFIYLILGESIHSSSVIGLGFIVLGIVIQQADRIKKPRLKPGFMKEKPQ